MSVSPSGCWSIVLVLARCDGCTVIKRTFFGAGFPFPLCTIEGCREERTRSARSFTIWAVKWIEEICCERLNGFRNRTQYPKLLFPSHHNCRSFPCLHYNTSGNLGESTQKHSWTHPWPSVPQWLSPMNPHTKASSTSFADTCALLLPPAPVLWQKISEFDCRISSNKNCVNRLLPPAQSFVKLQRFVAGTQETPSFLI